MINALKSAKLNEHLTFYGLVMQPLDSFTSATSCTVDAHVVVVAFAKIRSEKALADARAKFMTVLTA